MAIRVSVRSWILAFALLYVCLFWKNFGNADDDVPDTETGAGFGGAGAGTGGGGSGVGGTGAGAGGAGAGTGGAGIEDPSQFISKALLCFNDKNIYSSCEESYRLTESGNLNVPADKTDVFCEGPCLSETNLVLGCIDNIFSHFIFYNKATIEDIKYTIQAACGYGPERGNFNVAEHIQADKSKALKTTTSHVVMGFALIIMGRRLLL